ncbi:MAG: matrixin family metalloprotease [Candidatus Latescibacterota bacterium]|nr:matrixin family metalloprotease [Candidatus Latescibacterota bacterium]
MGPVLLSLLLVVTSAHGQEGVYHCQHDARLAATKQTLDTVFSEDGKYSYSVTRDNIPLIFDLRLKPVIDWYGATNMSANANAIVEQAFQDWTDATGINFQKLGNDENDIWPLQDNKSQVLIADPVKLSGAVGRNQRHISAAGPNTPPVVWEADIGFDPNVANDASDSFILSVARHEIGHLLGLQHVDVYNSLMYATLTRYGNTLDIDPASREGVAFLYGEKEDLDYVKSAYDESIQNDYLHPWRTDKPEFIRTPRHYVLIQDPAALGDLIVRTAEDWDFPQIGYGRPWGPSHPTSTLVWKINPGGDQIYRSVDGGVNWTSQLPENTTDPEEGISRTNPDVGYYQIGFGVYRTEDGGQSETYLSALPYFGNVNEYLVLNDFLAWFATEKGVYKTSDGGQSYIEYNRGLPEDFNVLTIAQDPSRSTTFYVGGDAGIYKSVNSAAQWTPMAKGLGVTTIKSIRVANDGRVYVLTDIGLYRLSDDESEWVRLSDTIGSFGLTGMLVNPGNSNEVYVSNLSGVFKSQNGGTSFSRINFLPELNHDPVIVKVLDPSTRLVLPAETLTIDIDSLATFHDANGDSLVYTVREPSRSDLEVGGENYFVHATVDGDRVSITPLRVGETQLYVIAEDGRGGRAEAWVVVSIAKTNSPVVTKQFISDLAITGKNLTIDVNSIATFTHPNGDPLSFSIPENEYVSAIIDGTTITLTPLGNESGWIKIYARDVWGRTAQADVWVFITDNRPPEWAEEVERWGISLDEIIGGPINVWPTFGGPCLPFSLCVSDPDRDPMTFEVISHPDFLVMAGITGQGQLAGFELAARGPGEGRIVVSVDDGNGHQATTDYGIVITAPTTGPPIALRYLDTIRVDADNLSGGITTVGLDSLFFNPDGDALTYEAVSAFPNVGSAEVNGNVVTLTPLASGLLEVLVTATDQPPSSGGGPDFDQVGLPDFSTALSSRVSIYMKVGTPPPPPTVSGPLATVEAAVGVPLTLDLSSFLSETSLTFSVYKIGDDAPTVGSFDTNGSGQFVFTGSTPGKGEFQIVAIDAFRQRVISTLTVSVTRAEEGLAPLNFRLDPQRTFANDRLAPGDTVSVELLCNNTEWSNLSGVLDYQKNEVTLIPDRFTLDTLAVETNIWFPNYENDDSKGHPFIIADQVSVATPMRLFTLSFLLMPGFDSTTGIRLLNTDTIDEVGNLILRIPLLEIKLQTEPSPDFDGDRTVGFSDFLEFAGAFGKMAPAGSDDAKYDLDRSGDIGFGDFLIFAAAFNTTL